MLGQAPFVGYAIVDFGADAEDEINIDTGLVPGGAEQPEWFVAVASQRELTPEGFSVIQLPFAGIGQKGGPRAAELERARASEKRALARIAKLESEQAEASAARPAAVASGAAQPGKGELEQLRRELIERDKWLAGLEARASTADQRADEMQGELERLREENTLQQAEVERLRGSTGEGTRLKSRLEEDKNVLRQELLSLRKQLDDQRKQLEDQRRLHDDARKQNEDVRRQLDDARKQQDDHGRRQVEEQRRVLDEQRKQQDEQRRREDEQRKLQDEQRKLQDDVNRRQLEDLRKQHDDARRQLDELRRQHDELKRRHDDELRRQASSAAEQDTLRKSLADLTRRLEEQSALVVTLNQQVSRVDAEPSDDITRLEEQLQERGREVARLEQAIAETERFGKQLIVQLEALKQGPGDATEAQLERLARRNAELEANLESARWTISQLELAPPELPKTAPDARDAEANVQRQAVLLEQARPGSG
jgi:chromosome segregation ATPase